MTLSIPEFETQREELHRAFSKADAAVALGSITQGQRDAFLTHLHGSADEREALGMLRARLPEEERGHDPRVLVAGFAILMISLFGTLLWLGGGITGAVVADTTLGINQTFTATDTLRVILDNTDAVTITGRAEGLGDVTVTLEINGTDHELYAYRHGAPATAHGSLERSRFASDEPVVLTSAGVALAVLEEPNGTLRGIDPAFSEALPEGSYAITLRGSEGDVPFEERLAFSVVAPGTPAPSEPVSTCGACSLGRATGTATLRVEIAGDATFTLDDIILTKLENAAPVLVAAIPDQAGATVMIDLSPYFADPDGDTLLYETSHPAGAAETLNGSVLTISGIGNYTYFAYASDLNELVQSNPFTVTLDGTTVDNATANATADNVTMTNATNATQNGTTEANVTENATTPANVTLNVTNATGTISENVTINATGNLTNATGCEDPDPNKRLASCLNVEGAKYFEEDVFLETVDRSVQARVTAIGNLLITGRVIERSAAIPGDRDYTIGYKDDDFRYNPTIWFDAGGNLHLRGELHEENANLNPPPGSFTVINRRGVYMLWADQYTGDLYLRGNAIPYRVSVYE